jgi:methyl-accepting chemotaxis protein
MSLMSDRLERRRHERAEVTGNVQLRFGSRAAEARLVDLSVSGLSCLTDAGSAPPDGATGQVTLHLADQDHTMSASVARRFTADDGERIGLQFVDTAPSVVRSIEEFLATLLDAGHTDAEPIN